MGIQWDILRYFNQYCNSFHYSSTDNIPRAATTSAATDFVSNTDPTITYSNPGGFTVDAYIEFPGGVSIYRYNIGSSGSPYTIKLTDTERQNLVKAIPNSTTLSVKLGIRTTISSTYYYSHVSKTMTVASNIVPTISDIVWTKTSNEPSNWPMTKGVSKGTMAMSGASGILGSTIKSYSLTFAGYSSTTSSLTVNNIASSGTLSAVASVTDTRNRTATKTVNFTVADYSKPQLTASVYRSDASGTEDAEGEYMCVSATASVTDVGGNTIQSFTLEYKRREDLSYTSEDLASSIPSLVTSSSLVVPASSDYTWDWKIVVYDKVQYSDAVGDIPTGAVILDIMHDGSGMGLGKVAEGPGLDVGWSMKLQGSPVADYVVEQGTSGIWIYRKWASGIAELWGVSDAITQTTDFDWGILTSNYPTPQLSYPFPFKNPPVVSPSIHTKSANFWLVAYADGTTTDTPTYQTARGANSATITFKIGYYVFGQWK